MSRIPALTYREVAARLRELGFEFDRQAKGSHEIWRNPKTKSRLTVPRHPGNLPRGTLRAIIRGTGLSVEQFLGAQRNELRPGDSGRARAPESPRRCSPKRR